MQDLLVERNEKRAEFAKRNKPYVDETVPSELQDKYEADGWRLYRKNKNSVRMRKLRPHDELLENRFWNILYRFGYSELNKGRNFKISVSKDGATTKQIDVFAKDAETVVVAECKSCLKPTKRALQKDINEFAGLKGQIAESIRKHYGSDFKPKIIWCFVTDNVRWSEGDLQRAADANIQVIRDVELIYFEEFSKKLGRAARHQFQAEYLSDQKVPAMIGRKVPAIRTKMGGTTAYLFSALPSDILRIGFVNHRDLRDPDGAPSYQRIVKPSRLKQIGQFLDQGGFFPNTVLLNFHRKPRFEQSHNDKESGIAFGSLILPEFYKSCWIIDGQHRLYGTSFAKEEYSEPLYFIGFDKVEGEDEAKMFVRINSKQEKVSATLLSALDGEVKWNSDVPKERLAAIASRAVDVLNSEGGGPLEGKFVSPGITAGNAQPLNVRSVQIEISRSGLVGSVNSRTGEIIGGPCWDSTSRESLRRLVSLLSQHFDEVRDANSVRWSEGKPGLLCTNFGVGSHVRLLSEAIRYQAQKLGFEPQASEIPDLYESIRPVLKPVMDFIESADAQQFERRFKVSFGSNGYQEYFFEMVGIVRDEFDDFKPHGYEEHMKRSTDDETKWADSEVKWIQAVVHDYVIDTLKTQVGPNYFEDIVPPQIQKSCQDRRIDDEGEKLSVEKYLDFIHLEKIASIKSAPSELKQTLSIPLDGEAKGKHFYNSWFNEINRLRRIAAHPTGRNYNAGDIKLIGQIAEELRQKLPMKYVGQ